MEGYEMPLGGAMLGDMTALLNKNTLLAVFVLRTIAPNL
jgi:hypothetical protein